MISLKSILFILHQPPPIHGSSIVGAYIKNSKLINSSFQANYINILTSYSLNEIGKYSFNKIFRFFKIYYRTILYNIKYKPNLCYLAITINGKAFYRDVLIVIILKIFRRRIVLHLHNKGASTFNNILRKLCYRFVFNNIKVILLSDILYSDIERYAKKEQLYICPNGIPKNSTVITNNKRNNEIVNLLFLSNIMIEKGVLILLDVCTKLKERGIKFICHFVGGWKDISEEKVNEIVLKNNLENFVYFHGPKYNEEKNEFWKKADIFVFPTFYSQECFPLVLLEALQNNLPVVSTFEGGIPDIVFDGETGFLCEQKDANCLVEKIEYLIDNPAVRKKMGVAGRKRYEENFTFEHFEKRLVNIFEKIINE